MRRVRRALVLLHRALICLLAGAFLWGWIFTFLTDAKPENKIVIYANLREGSWKELAVALEQDAPESIRFVQVRPFSYALMNSNGLRGADLYVMTAPAMAEYGDWLGPVPEALAEKYPDQMIRIRRDGTEEDADRAEDLLTGIRIYQAETGEGAAKAYLSYFAERPDEDWYLCFGRNGLHTGITDDAALILAEAMLRLP